MNSTTEFYFLKGQKYSHRKDFFDKNDRQTWFPDFLTETRFQKSVSSTLPESIHSVLKRCASTNQPLYLLYSGGIDSELIFSVALKKGVQVIPVIVDLFGMNTYELQFAKRFLERNAIAKYLWVEISETDFYRKWLPELLVDIESLSFLLAGAYIAARSCPTDSLIVYSGENPDVIYVKDTLAFITRHEYSLWAQKVSRKRDLNIVEVFADTDVRRSYLQSPAISERLLSNVPFPEWSADHEYLGKEFLYQLPEIDPLPRRYAQHGWESIRGSKGYSKGMTPLGNPLAQHFKEREVFYLEEYSVIPWLLFSMTEKALDYDLAYECIFKKHVLKDFSKTGMRSGDFNRIFYCFLGKLTENQVNYPQSSVVHVSTSNAGELTDFEKLSATLSESREQLLKGFGPQNE